MLRAMDDGSNRFLIFGCQCRLSVIVRRMTPLETNVLGSLSWLFEGYLVLGSSGYRLVYVWGREGVD
jgi:hypothetical protein